jgi:hypothetical protein
MEECARVHLAHIIPFPMGDWNSNTQVSACTSLSNTLLGILEDGGVGTWFVCSLRLGQKAKMDSYTNY